MLITEELISKISSSRFGTFSPEDYKESLEVRYELYDAKNKNIPYIEERIKNCNSCIEIIEKRVEYQNYPEKLEKDFPEKKAKNYPFDPPTSENLTDFFIVASKNDIKTIESYFGKGSVRSKPGITSSSSSSSKKVKGAYQIELIGLETIKPKTTTIPSFEPLSKQQQEEPLSNEKKKYHVTMVPKPGESEEASISRLKQVWGKILKDSTYDTHKMIYTPKDFNMSEKEFKEQLEKYTIREEEERIVDTQTSAADTTNTAATTTRNVPQLLKMFVEESKPKSEVFYPHPLDYKILEFINILNIYEETGYVKNVESLKSFYLEFYKQTQTMIESECYLNSIIFSNLRELGMSENQIEKLNENFKVQSYLSSEMRGLEDIYSTRGKLIQSLNSEKNKQATVMINDFFDGVKKQAVKDGKIKIAEEADLPSVDIVTMYANSIIEQTESMVTQEYINEMQNKMKIYIENQVVKMSGTLNSKLIFRGMSDHLMSELIFLVNEHTKMYPKEEKDNSLFKQIIMKAFRLSTENHMKTLSSSDHTVNIGVNPFTSIIRGLILPLIYLFALYVLFCKCITVNGEAVNKMEKKKDLFVPIYSSISESTDALVNLISANINNEGETIVVERLEPGEEDDKTKRITMTKGYKEIMNRPVTLYNNYPYSTAVLTDNNSKNYRTYCENRVKELKEDLKNIDEKIKENQKTAKDLNNKQGKGVHTKAKIDKINKFVSVLERIRTMIINDIKHYDDTVKDLASTTTTFDSAYYKSEKGENDERDRKLNTALDDALLMEYNGFEFQEVVITPQTWFLDNQGNPSYGKMRAVANYKISEWSSELEKCVTEQETQGNVIKSTRYDESKEYGAIFGISGQKIEFVKLQTELTRIAKENSNDLIKAKDIATKYLKDKEEYGFFTIEQEGENGEKSVKIVLLHKDSVAYNGMINIKRIINANQRLTSLFFDTQNTLHNLFRKAFPGANINSNFVNNALSTLTMKRLSADSTDSKNIPVITKQEDEKTRRKRRNKERTETITVLKEIVSDNSNTGILLRLPSSSSKSESGSGVVAINRDIQKHVNEMEIYDDNDDRVVNDELENKEMFIRAVSEESQKVSGVKDIVNESLEFAEQALKSDPRQEPKNYEEANRMVDGKQEVVERGIKELDARAKQCIMPLKWKIETAKNVLTDQEAYLNEENWSETDKKEYSTEDFAVTVGRSKYNKCVSSFLERKPTYVAPSTINYQQAFNEYVEETFVDPTSGSTSTSSFKEKEPSKTATPSAPAATTSTSSYTSILWNFIDYINYGPTMYNIYREGADVFSKLWNISGSFGTSAVFACTLKVYSLAIRAKIAVTSIRILSAISTYASHPNLKVVGKAASFFTWITPCLVNIVGFPFIPIIQTIEHNFPQSNIQSHARIMIDGIATSALVKIIYRVFKNSNFVINDNMIQTLSTGFFTVFPGFKGSTAEAFQTVFFGIITAIGVVGTMHIATIWYYQSKIVELQRQKLQRQKLEKKEEKGSYSILNGLGDSIAIIVNTLFIKIFDMSHWTTTGKISPVFKKIDTFKTFVLSTIVKSFMWPFITLDDLTSNNESKLIVENIIKGNPPDKDAVLTNTTLGWLFVGWLKNQIIRYFIRMFYYEASKKIIGDPLGTLTKSVEELKKQEIDGGYKTNKGTIIFMNSANTQVVQEDLQTNFPGEADQDVCKQIFQNIVKNRNVPSSLPADLRNVHVPIENLFLDKKNEYSYQKQLLVDSKAADEVYDEYVATTQAALKGMRSSKTNEIEISAQKAVLIQTGLTQTKNLKSWVVPVNIGKQEIED